MSDPVADEINARVAEGWRVEEDHTMTPPHAPGFMFADLHRRVFLKESREGTYYHLVHPADGQDRRVQDQLVTAGMLVCDGCKGGRYRGSCHAVKSAEELLHAAGLSVVDADWLESESREAFGK